jgi:hypothetical protein
MTDTIQVKLRVTPELKARLVNSAKVHGLTLNAEIIIRLLHSLETLK